MAPVRVATARLSTVIICAVRIALPFSWIGSALGFVPLSWLYWPLVAAMLEGARAARPTSAAMEELCTQRGTGVTAWPFAEIDSKVGLNADQKQFLDQVRSAGQTAAGVFKASCPAKNAFAMTPPGRLQAMTLQLTATFEAVQTARPAMEL